MSRHLLQIVAALFAVCAATMARPLVAAEATPADASAERERFFTTKVAPVLKERCYACHSHAAKKDSGSLMLDSRGAMLTGGDSGPALVPGKPDESLLITAVKYDEEYPKMPPKGKLADDEIAVLIEWVKQGAVWPGGSDAKPSGAREKITDEDRAYWAFQPLRETTPPQAADPAWNQNPIDRFLYAKLDAAGLKPSPAADPATLIRRLYFDLLGLPPTPEEVDEFVREYSASPSLSDSPTAKQSGESGSRGVRESAYATLVDRLLASPRHGEHWARHWLDLVRYAESDGYRIDDYRPEAWRYRDYVIKSLNNDKPYDQFVREQLAGDEIAPDDPDALTATGFLRLGIYEYNARDVRGQWQVMLDDVTDVVGDVFLGLGMGCAKCHDHKFDPILQRDYFALQAFLTAIQPHDDLPIASEAEQAAHRKLVANWEQKAAEVLKRLEAIEGPARRNAAKQAVEKFPEDIQAMINKPEHERLPLEAQLAALAYRQVYYEYDRLDRRFKDEAKEKLVAVRKELAAVSSDRPEPLPRPMTVRDVGPEAPPVLIPKKGNDPVAPAFLTVLGEEPPQIVPPRGPTFDRFPSTGRRKALAEWLTKPDHRLTSRVIVNRVWQYHFGRGLVRTASDFGRLGEPPTHPELLDWLAVNFVREGWSLKKLHRLIVTSQAYQQASGQWPLASGQLKTGKDRLAASLATRSNSAIRNPQSAIVVDPENRLLWRMPNCRLDAEQVRDALLAAIGKLELTDGGPAVDVSQPRRSIYCRVTRNSRDPLLEVFDVPEGFQSAAERNVTTTPTQALLMINSPTMLDHARSFAKHLRELHPGGGDDSAVLQARVESAFRLAFGRRPTADEQRSAQQFAAAQAKRIRPDDAPSPVVKLDKIPYRDGHAVVLDPAGPMRRAEAAAGDKLPSGDFTIEAFVVLRSTYENASVRTIAAHWNGDKATPGWLFGVTSLRSQFKPQMLVLQLWGEDASGKPHYEPIFSSLNVQLNKPYYVAVSVKLVETGVGGITFFAKDLSNDDEPMLQSQSPHTVVKIRNEPVPFTIGGRAGLSFGNLWDGLVDDVRLSREALDVGRLLLTAEQLGPATVGFWEFEPAEGLFRDSSPNHLDLSTGEDSAKTDAADARDQAFIDFCHVLLNANEFLYVD
jgi:hypothetical protein